MYKESCHSPSHAHIILPRTPYPSPYHALDYLKLEDSRVTMGMYSVPRYISDGFVGVLRPIIQPLSTHTPAILLCGWTGGRYFLELPSGYHSHLFLVDECNSSADWAFSIVRLAGGSPRSNICHLQDFAAGV